MGLTLVEKIAARHADGLPAGAVVRAGDFVSIRPRHVMTHDNTGAVMPKFKQIGATAIRDPAAAGLRDRSRHSKHHAEEPGEVRQDRSVRPRAGGRLLPARHRHLASGHGGAGLCRSRRVGRGERFALQSVWRGRGAGHAGRADRRGEHLGDWRDLVAGAAGREGRAEGKALARRHRQGRDHRSVRPLQQRRGAESRGRIRRRRRGGIFDGRAHDDRQHDDRMGRARRCVSIRRSDGEISAFAGRCV